MTTDASSSAGRSLSSTRDDRGEVEVLVRVDDRRDAADGVVALTLVPVDGSPLPEWSPGAHVDLMLPGGLTRQYSLCGTPDDRGRWSIAVLLESSGRGGSVYVHERLVIGTELLARGPRNHFALVETRRYIFVAGGIGITPILPMIRAVSTVGADWEVHYGGRRRASMAFCAELEAIGGDRVHIYPQDEVGHIDLSALRTPIPETAVYCCGPAPLLRAVADSAQDWPPEALRVERFSPRDVVHSGADGTFEVELARTKVTLTVPSSVSVLEVLEAAGIDVWSSCREGICGTCETAVLDGEVEHRDAILTDSERAAQDTMFICVSRARSRKLTLDL